MRVPGHGLVQPILPDGLNFADTRRHSHADTEKTQSRPEAKPTGSGYLSGMKARACERAASEVPEGERPDRAAGARASEHRKSKTLVEDHP